MPTYGDGFLDDYEGAIGRLAQLTHRAYEEHDVRDAVSKIGTKTELFLKATVFPAKNPRDNFYSFIEELSSIGLIKRTLISFTRYENYTMTRNMRRMSKSLY